MRRGAIEGSSRSRKRQGRATRWVGLALTLCCVLAMLPATARAITGRAGVLVVLCNFTDQQVQPNPVSYYEHMFGHVGAGEMGAWEYWYDVSLHNLDISENTDVHGWYTLNMTRDQWVALSRNEKWRTCAEAAAPDVDYHRYVGVVAIYPQAASFLAAPVGTSDTSLTLTSTTAGDAANFPTPPFQLWLVQSGPTCTNSPPPYNCEIEEVTAVNGTTFTVQRNTGKVPGGSHSRRAPTPTSLATSSAMPRKRNLSPVTTTRSGVPSCRTTWGLASPSTRWGTASASTIRARSRSRLPTTTTATTR